MRLIDLGGGQCSATVYMTGLGVAQSLTHTGTHTHTDSPTHRAIIGA